MIIYLCKILSKYPCFAAVGQAVFIKNFKGDKEMISLINKDKQCRDCFFARFIGTNNGKRPLIACGYICYLNPFKPIAMGLRGKHSERQEIIEEQQN